MPALPGNQEQDTTSLTSFLPYSGAQHARARGSWMHGTSAPKNFFVLESPKSWSSRIPADNVETRLVRPEFRTRMASLESDASVGSNNLLALQVGCQ